MHLPNGRSKTIPQCTQVTNRFDMLGPGLANLTAKRNLTNATDKG